MDEWSWWLVRVIGGTFLGGLLRPKIDELLKFRAKKTLQDLEDEFNELQNKEVNKRDEDLEEILGNLIIELEQLDISEPKDYLRVLQMRRDANKAYRGIKKIKITDSQENSDESV